MTKHLDQRLRSQSGVALLLERHEHELGKENYAVVERLTDDIARASFTVWVGLPEQKERLEELLEKRESVGRAISRLITEETAYQEVPGRAEGDKKASAKRVASYKQRLTQVEQSIKVAVATEKAFDSALAERRREYQLAIDKLMQRISELRSKSTGTSKK